MNPDNLATPLAASIGDVVAISLLSFIASLLFEHIGKSNPTYIHCPAKDSSPKNTSIPLHFRHAFVDHIRDTGCLLHPVAVLGKCFGNT